MEQQCEIGGEGLRRNGDVVNEEMISELPEVLLLHILSSLPTETAIVTSVLSKRWKSLWKMLPNLKLYSKSHETFTEDVCRVLLLHKAPVLESLQLKAGYEYWPTDMDLCIGIALARHVRKLVLKSLRELHLCDVCFKDEESVSNLLCSCPSLEDLVVHRGSYCSAQTFTIAVPSLQRLTIKDDYVEGGGEWGYVINSPSLKYLNLEDLNRLEFVLIENAPELVEAKITKVGGINNENILASLMSAKRLSLHLSPYETQIKYSTGIIFYQLLSLELCTNEKEWRNLLSIMLDSSPKLQSLKLLSQGVRDKDHPISQKWNQPKCVPECLLFHLETFEWQQEDENEVATYILKNARCLKKATLSTIPIGSEDFEKLEKRREMLKELTSVVRASDSCHLVCEAETYLKSECT